MPPRFRKRLILIRPLQFIMLALLAYGGYALELQMRGNFHEVIPGQLYRAAQPSAKELADYTKRYGIRSILNLRGENDGAQWYQEEAAEAKILGVKHLDFRMKASRELTAEQANSLIAMMRDAPKPLLLHCQHGADRTGLASALYILTIAHGTEAEADQQLSLYYGHIPFSFGKGYAMSTSFEHLKPALGY